ncbi:MAG: hypothetical protein ACJA2W_002773 [Planctomycetota bacterium]|jgi:hypothetical protein
MTASDSTLRNEPKQRSSKASSSLWSVATPLLIAGALASVGLDDQPGDILVLKDGRIIDGFEMEQADGHVIVQLEAGNIEINDNLVDALLEKDKEISFVPQNSEETEKLEQGLVWYEGRWTKLRTATKKIQKSVDGRIKQAEEDKQHEMWKDRYITETKYFEWQHTTPLGTTERYIDACDAYYEIFKKDWKIKRDKKKKKLPINFYTDRKEFQRGAGGGGGALAYFRFVEPYDLCAFYDRLDPQFTEQVLFHELGHYLHKLIDEDFKYPHWPGESLSEYYGGAKWDPATKKLEVGMIHNGRLATIKREIGDGKKIDLREMITTKGFEDYTWGWAFVHMLMNDKQYAKKFKKFFLGLATDKTVKRTRASFNLKFVEGEEVLRFFMECMDLEDMDDLRELQTQWYDYITDVLEFTGENALIWEAKTASSLGEKKRARELYEKAFKEDMESPLAKAHFDYAQLLRSTSNKKDRALHLRKAVEKAPLTAEYRFTLGQELSRSSDKDAKAEGEKMVAIAIELDPYITQSILFLDFD